MIWQHLVQLHQEIFLQYSDIFCDVRGSLLLSGYFFFSKGGPCLMFQVCVVYL